MGSTVKTTSRCTQQNQTNSQDFMQIKMATGNSESRVPMTLRDSFFNDDFFRNSWEDFDKLRQQMTSESQNFWKRAEQEMKMLETSASSTMQQSSSSSSSNTARKESSSATSGARDLMRSDSMLVPSIFPRRWMMPRMFGIDNTGVDSAFSEDFFNDRFMKGLDLFQDKGDEQIIRRKDDDSKFELSLDTHGFRPDEIKVSVAGGVLGVEAMHEEKGDNKHILRQFSRKYTLPEGCEAAKVNSNLSSDSVLVITAPKKQAIKTTVATNTPIPVEVKKLETSASSAIQQQGASNISSSCSNVVRKECASSSSATSGVNSNLSSGSVKVITAPMKQTIKATVASTTPIPLEVKKLETSASSDMQQQGSSSSSSSNAVRRESASSSSATSGVNSNLSSDSVQVITAPIKQTINATVAANTPIPVEVKKLKTSANSDMQQQGSSSISSSISSSTSNAVR